MTSDGFVKEKILCFGDCNIDMVVPVDEIPVKGGCSFSEEMSVNVGGSMINTAAALASLNMPVGIVTKIGNDIFGNMAIEFFKENNIGTENLLKSSYPTGIAFALVENDGEKRWIAIRKKAADIHMNSSEIDEIETPEILFITGVELVEGKESRDSAIAFAKRVKARGGSVFLDPNIRIPAWELDEDIRGAFENIFPYVDVLLANEIEIDMLGSNQDPEKAAFSVIEKGVKSVWVKLGEKGSLYVDPEKVLAFEPVKVKVVDTCGAGDAFNAAVIYAAVGGWRTEQAGRFANRYAAHTVGKQGSTSSLPRPEEVRHMLESIQVLEETDRIAYENGYSNEIE